ncbi:MAG: FKBP-type peptidyl-prolyl cis-trans isomerase [Myxococcota bacterium]|nr:FKBP-type peptidyl-prolyl cis-trans isomerase [Myxococcota bacterium]
MNLLISMMFACGGDAIQAPAQAPAPAEAPTPAEAPAPQGGSGAAGGVYASDTWDPIQDGIPEIDESNTRTTETGLTIVTIAEGTGAAPAKGKNVSVHYHGWLASDGSLFDSSSKRGKPLDFPVGVGMVIPGWDEGILSLKEGGKARLRIPANLGYGDRGAGGKIPPGADLVFDVWLVGASS